MRPFFLLLVLAATAAAESHPSWWIYSSPEATTLVGVNWEYLRQSPFADPVEAELSSTGSLGFPDLECLKQARQILISSPALLATEVGTFPASTLEQQALQKGLHRASYHGVTMWLPSQADTPGVAAISEELILVGARKTLEAAVDRAASGAVARQYSPLLARAARFAESRDLWVVATHLPDPLASVFVPFEVETLGFDGAVSVRNGLTAEASFAVVSPDAAEVIGESFRRQIPSLPSIAHGLRVNVDGIRVDLALEATPEQLSAELRSAPAAVGSAPAALPPEPPKPAEPQVIRIFGLDGGTREIPFPSNP